jgi:hypothetical protein
VRPSSSRAGNAGEAAGSTAPGAQVPTHRLAAGTSTSTSSAAGTVCFRLPELFGLQDMPGPAPSRTVVGGLGLPVRKTSKHKKEYWLCATAQRSVGACGNRRFGRDSIRGIPKEPVGLQRSRPTISFVRSSVAVLGRLPWKSPHPSV